MLKTNNGSPYTDSRPTRKSASGDRSPARLRILFDNARSSDDIRTVYVLTRVGFLLFLGVLVLIGITFAVSSENRIASNNAAYAEISAESLARDNLRGSIYDRNGVLLAQTVRNEDGTKSRNYQFIESFAHILGRQPGASFGNNGVEVYYNESLVGVRNANIKALRGDDLHLSIDAQLQNYIYSVFSSFTGGAVVSDCRTGEVLAMVSTPSYDFTLPAETAKEKYNNGEYVNNCMAPLTPGSVFKLLTACVLTDNNCLPVLENDRASHTFAGVGTISNAGKTAFVNVDICRAIEVSSNVWFSRAAWQLCNGDNAFSANTYINGIENLGMGVSFPTQLGRITQRHAITADAKWELLQSSFGQGALEISPLYMNIFVSALATDGQMRTPTFVSKTVNPKGKTVEETEPTELGYRISEEARATVLQGMKQAADSYKLYWNGQASSVYAKTGTAEITETRNNKWLTCAFPASSPRYTLTLVSIEGLGMSSALYEPARQILDFLAQQEAQAAAQQSQK